MQDVTSALDLGLKQGMYLFRDKSRPDLGVHAIWFPEADAQEGVAVVKAINRIVKQEQQLAAGGPAAGAIRQPGSGAQAEAASVQAAGHDGQLADWTGGQDAGKALLSMLQRGPSVGALPAAAPAAGSKPAAAAPVQPQQQGLAPGVAALFSQAGKPAGAATASPAASAAQQPQPSVGSGGGGFNNYAAAPAATQAAALQQQNGAGHAPGSARAAAPAAPAAQATGGLVGALLSTAQAQLQPTASAASSASPATPVQLTKQQLQSVLLDMLKEDAFVEVLHARYVQSLSERSAFERLSKLGLGGGQR